MDYSSVKKIPFKGYARAYETTDKRLFCDPESGKEVVKEEKRSFSSVSSLRIKKTSRTITNMT